MSTVTVTLATDPTASHVGTSLRDAIALVDAGTDNVIAFNIAGAGAKTIAVSSLLPAITKPVTIDGTTEPGYAGKPLIALTRASSSVAGYGLLITGGGTTVKGVAIYGFTGYGLRLMTGGGNTIAADYLGVNTTGTSAPGNGSGGLWLDGSSGNTVGGTAAASRNIISGNGGEGIRADGGSVGNTIAGNTIGTDLTGTLNLPNQTDGISIANSGGSAANTIVNNMIANNDYYGIGLVSATNVLIQGNVVTKSEHRGIAIIGSSKVTVGGTASGSANTITANGLKDGDLNSFAAGVAVVNGSSNVSVTGNTISGNGRGVRVSGSGTAGSSPSITISNNTIAGNSTQGIWVDDVFGGPSQNVMVSGDTIEGNTAAGLRVDDSSGIRVGQAGQPVNAIVNNGANGVALYTTTNVVLTNNIISFNTGNGVLVGAGSGGVTLPSANTVESNVLYGVEVLSASVALPSTTSNTISGNIKGNVYKPT